jgi:hypothetical protein
LRKAAEKKGIHQHKGAPAMKCPKCGYNSFEYLDNCRKCGSSQTAFRESLGLRPVILAPALAAVVSEMTAEELTIPPQVVPDPETADQIFQWDPPAETAGPAAVADEAFSDFSLGIDEESPQEAAENSLAPADDPFAFSEGETPEPPAVPAPPSPEVASTFGDFSFDEPLTSLPETGTTTANVADSEPYEAESAEPAADPFAAAEFSLDSFESLSGEQETGEASTHSATSGEFDLDSFLSMDIEASPTAGKGAAKSASDESQLNRDEFDALFGDLELENKP